MNNTIWKFALKIDDDNYIEMPRNAEILSVGLQENNPVLWALVNSNEQIREMRHIKTYGTGHHLDFETSEKKFLGTIQPVENSVSFAFHLFEVL